MIIYCIIQRQVPSLSLTHPFSTSHQPRITTSLVPHTVVRVRQVQVPIRALLRQHHHPDDTAGAAVPLDGLPQRALNERHGLVLLHALPPVRVAVTVDVRRAGPADRVGLLVQGAAEGDGVDLAAEALVPAGDDEARPRLLSASCIHVVKYDESFGGFHIALESHQGGIARTKDDPCSRSKSPGRSKQPFASSGACRSAWRTDPAGTGRYPPPLVCLLLSRSGSTKWCRVLS